MAQRFAQISDPHLSDLQGVRPVDLLSKRLLGYLSWRRRRRFEHRREVLDALSADLAGQSLDQLLVSGDLTHIGLPSEFRQARRWLEQLGDARAVALIPGNHDACVSTAWEDSFALWREYMASDDGGRHSTASPGNLEDFFPSYRQRGGVAYIGLSSACPTPPLMASGEVGPGQLEQLPAVLDRAHEAGMFRVVYIHHSPLAGEEKWRKRLRNAPAVSAILAEHGAELVLHGHGHRAREGRLESRHGEIPVIAVPSASALGLHGADVAAYNTYQVEAHERGWELNIATRRYDRDGGSFTAGGERFLVLERER